MRARRSLVAVALALLAVVVHYLYNPLPSGLDQKWKYSIIVSAVRVMSDVSYFCGWIGLADERVCLRHVIAASGYFSSVNTTGVNVTDQVFAGVPVRLYVPDRQAIQKRGGLVYLHGGGFIAGHPKAYDSYCVHLSRNVDVVVVSVHYRRTPEHPSPIPLSDAYAAATHFFAHAKTWMVDPSFIGVAGDSAGGTLAAALALRLRDEYEANTGYGAAMRFRFRFQVLAYPLLQGLSQNLPSYQQNDYHAIVWTKRWCVAGVVWTYIRGMQNYRKYVTYMLNETHVPRHVKITYGKFIAWKRLPQWAISPDYRPIKNHDEFIEHEGVVDALTNPYNFPLMALNLSGLPESYIMTAEFDPIRDDGMLYAQRLNESGVPVVHDYFPQGWHGMVSGVDGIFSFDICKHAMDNITNFVRQHVDTSLESH